MPPQVSSPEQSDSDSIDEIPAKPIPPKPALPIEDEDEGDEELSDEEFVVEKIVAHKSTKKGLVYRVKWLGYDAETDMTWEPVENLDNAVEKVNEYKATIGGTPEAEGKKKAAAKGGSAKKGATKRGASEAFDSPAPQTSTKKSRGGRKSETNGVAPKTEREYPAGLWETDVLQVASIVEDNVKNPAKTGKAKETSTLFGLLEWHDGHRSQHPLRTLRTKCPQKLLDYYEQHLVFTKDE